MFNLMGGRFSDGVAFFKCVLLNQGKEKVSLDASTFDGGGKRFIATRLVGEYLSFDKFGRLGGVSALGEKGPVLPLAVVHKSNYTTRYSMCMLFSDPRQLSKPVHLGRKTALLA